MEFQATYQDSVWLLTPLSGTLVGKVVATAEAVELSFATFDKVCVTGTIKAVHGLDNIIDWVYEDAETLRALKINHAFRFRGNKHGRIVSGMIVDESGFQLVGARNVTCIGHNVHWRGI